MKNKNLNIPNNTPLNQSSLNVSYLILSGEGSIDTQHQFCMECKTLEEANKHFDNLKRGEFKNTYLFIYESVKLREA